MSVAYEKWIDLKDTEGVHGGLSLKDAFEAGAASTGTTVEHVYAFDAGRRGGQRAMLEKVKYIVGLEKIIVDDPNGDLEMYGVLDGEICSMSRLKSRIDRLEKEIGDEN